MIRNHSGKVYHCHICGQKFSLPENMKRHVQTVHMKTKISCPDCGKEFTCKDHLRRHCKSVHEGKRHQCSFCEKNYSQAGDLHRHMKLVHGAKGTNELKMAHAHAVKMAAGTETARSAGRDEEGGDLPNVSDVTHFNGDDPEEVAIDAGRTNERLGGQAMNAIADGNSSLIVNGDENSDVDLAFISSAATSASLSFINNEEIVGKDGADGRLAASVSKGSSTTTSTTTANALREFALQKSSQQFTQHQQYQKLSQQQQAQLLQLGIKTGQHQLFQEQLGTKTTQQLNQHQQQHQQQPQHTSHHLSTSNTSRHVFSDVTFNFLDSLGHSSSLSSSTSVATRLHSNGFNASSASASSFPPSQLPRHLTSDEAKLLTPALTTAIGASLPVNAFLPSHEHASLVSSAAAAAASSSSFAASAASALVSMPAQVSSSHV